MYIFKKNSSIKSSLFKFQYFNYNKRMTINKEMLKKSEKIAKDLYKLNDYTEFTDLALAIQSDMFHENLFQNLRSSFKGEKDTKNKIKDMASKAGLKTEVIQEKYTNGFNQQFKDFFDEVKKNILEKAKTDPNTLKTDPNVMEKLKTPDGLLEFVSSRDMTITPETALNIPELNQMVLDTNPADMLKNFAELYFAGIIDEDRMRLYPHTMSMKDYLNNFEKELDETLTITNEMWVAKLKSDTYNYIKLVLSPEFEKKSLSYVTTTDNMRVDAGLVISREPILVSAQKEDMEFGKYRRTQFKKYFYNVDKHLEEIDTFNDVSSDYWDLCSGQFKLNHDNKPNIRKWNKDKNAYDFYCLNSKHWTLTDPNVTDNKSIQYSSMDRTYMLFKNKKNGQYEFPTISLYNGDSFYDSKYKLFFFLAQDEFKVFYKNPFPVFQITRDFHEYEKEDPKNKGLSGVRTFYFDALHFRGAPVVKSNVRHPYTDHVFSSKRELSKYVNKNYWEAVIPSLQEK
jgi:hypothetical protein